MKAIINTTEIENICVYHDAYDLIDEHLDREEWLALSEDAKLNLKHLTDWDYQDFIVINDEEVVSTDRLTGDVVAYEPITEFIRMAIEAATAEE